VSEELKMPLHSTVPASVEAGRARSEMSDFMVGQETRIKESKRLDDATGTIGEGVELPASATFKASKRVGRVRVMLK
jgi:hypothetical protein